MASFHKKYWISFLLFSVISSTYIFSQTDNIFIPRDIKNAYIRGTRSYDGNPGPAYFQNQADYTIDASFDPYTRKLQGSEIITFHNNSTRNLKYIVIRNYLDVYKKGAIRGRAIDPVDAGNEVFLHNVVINGKTIDLGSPDEFVENQGTDIILNCKTNAGSSSQIEISWSLKIPEKTHERLGPIDETSYFIAYWFPQISVFDDINGWDNFSFNNLSEMYTEFGNYRVSLSVPENFIVWATGELQNPEEVLETEYLEKFQRSKESEEIIHIVTNEDLINNKVICKPGKNTWVFQADTISDFAFGTSDHYLWDASQIVLNEDKKVHVQSAFLNSSLHFHEVSKITPWVIKTLSEEVVGYPFPFSTMTVFNGLDGMEYPMIVNDAEMEDRAGTYFITAHEVAHSYFPFLVGTNQKRHGWMDEGLTTLLGVETHTKVEKDFNFRKIYLEWYPYFAGTQEDIPSIVNSVYLPDIVFQQHEYVRSSLAFWILKDILGEELFYSSIREFIKRWKFKHPTPYDLFFTFNDHCKEDLNWFFEAWFLSFGYPDLGIVSADIVDNEWIIEISNIGGMPFPSKLEILFSDLQTQTIPVDARGWRNSKTQFIKIPVNKDISEFVLITDGYPDCELENNYFSGN
ncbi:MAG: M1 family metallopeptidase [Bacteroidales bacterium]|nr:M1 family metallopeptidase [Bacteroidales bacterium]MCF8391649.1 M1 family metallopeptidase [Bacteroidales bacterium]